MTATDLSQTLGCSELVTHELLTTGHNTANGFRELANIWTFDLMLEAKRAISKKREILSAAYNKLPDDKKWTWDDATEDVKATRKNRKNLSKETRQMLEAFERTQATWQTFRLARARVADLRGKSDHELLTAVFEAAHAANELHAPEKVIEGRTIYEAMLRDRELLCDLGVIPK
ncbi:hypothetical protein [Halocynthiibacter sp.]|uniref:hypothetical protein n=1 Tax=Halocynthiibacter sp. TaxID=1979210 RepID=UPI003C323DFA